MCLCTGVQTGGGVWSFECCCTTAVCQSNDTAKGHPEERAGKPHTQVETIIPRNVEVQTAIHMQLGFSNSGEDLD